MHKNITQKEAYTRVMKLKTPTHFQLTEYNGSAARECCHSIIWYQ